VLHILLHMAQQDGPVTSEVLAQAMNTNPVVIRRIMAGLRSAGYVQSEKGHGGGWTLTCDLSQVTLRDIYNALGHPSLLAIGNRTEAPGCLIEQAVNAALNQSFQSAEELLLASFENVTLAMLSADVRGRLAARAEVHAGTCAGNTGPCVSPGQLRALLGAHIPDGSKMPPP
jgi:DNA-binding IscR family transcriptional regulator